MRLPHLVPTVTSLPELRTHNRKSFGVTVTEAEEPESDAIPTPGVAPLSQWGALAVSMSELHETSNQKSDEEIDTVGWVFAAVVVIITAIAAIIAYQASDTMVANAPMSHMVAR
jgi:hypothetical protein